MNAFWTGSQQKQSDNYKTGSKMSQQSWHVDDVFTPLFPSLLQAKQPQPIKRDTSRNQKHQTRPLGRNQF